MTRKTHILHGRYSPIRFILEGLDTASGNVDAIEFVTLKRKLLQIIVQGLGLTRLFPNVFFTKDTVEALKGVKNGERIIVIDNLRRPIMKAMKTLLPDDVECHLFLWTPIPRSKRNSHRLHERAKMFHLSSFDEQTRAMFPDINIESSFYRFPPAAMTKQVDMSYDCFFIGYDKGRNTILEDIRDDIERAGLTSKFMIFQRGEKPMPYKESLMLMMQGRCIVDVTLSTNGMTLRPLEALFFHKKLITNNPEIAKEHLFHPQNVFIWGVDSIERLHEFVYSPFHEMPADILEYYDINAWVERFGMNAVNHNI